MGTGYHSGFGKTNGVKDHSLYQSLEENKQVTTESDDLLIFELEQKGIKFNKADIVFITRDGTGQIIWLEKGGDSAGLKHIISRHSDDFLSKHGVEEAGIPNHIETIIRSGSVEYSRIVRENGGYERLYNYAGKYYLLSGIGKNGFLVSAYPIGKETAQKLIGRYGK